jgi:hypothetical protein
VRATATELHKLIGVPFLIIPQDRSDQSPLPRPIATRWKEKKGEKCEFVHQVPQPGKQRRPASVSLMGWRGGAAAVLLFMATGHRVSARPSPREWVSGSYPYGAIPGAWQSFATRACCRYLVFDFQVSSENAPRSRSPVD